ncbi:MAG TPA: NBR1-Ig-like domain-containing protein [Anaerolineales bacterium]
MKKISVLWTILLGLSLILSACRPAAPVSPTPTLMDANAVFTAAAQTAQAKMTEIAAITPTPIPATATSTPAPATATSQATTPPAVTPSSTSSSSGSAAGDKAQFAADISVPDGTRFSPGQSFTKTWQLKNVGTTTWTTSYSFAYVSGEKMGAPASVKVPKETAPGGTVELSVDMVAPSNTGTYRGYWRMINANGQFFDVSVYVDIVVISGTPGTGTPSTGTPGTGTPTATTAAGTPGTPAATSSPTASAGSGGISNVTFSVDNASFTGSCPHTYVFTAQFTLDQPTTVTYQLEAETGFAITLPAPVTTALPAGIQTLTYNLAFNAALNGTARLHITAPADLASNKVDFSLKCQ